jgi:hypothetical protein
MKTKVINKGEVWLSQKEKVFRALYRQPQTRLQVSKETGVPLQNICRYIRDFRKSEAVMIITRDVCPVSGMKSEILSTNPAYRTGHQIKMFE